MSSTKTSTPDSAVPIEEVVALCRRLRLKYVREQAQDVLLTARAQRWDPAEMLRSLLVSEVEGRERSTVESKRRRAHFPAGKTFDTWIESRSSITQATQRALKSLEWVQRAENLVVAGPQGTGKSHLLEAIGHLAVDQKLSVAWFSVEDLGTIVRRHRVDDTVSKTFSSLAMMALTVSTTSACCRSQLMPQRASIAWSTWHTSNDRLPCPRTCIRLGSTSSWTRQLPLHSLTASCTMRTSSSQKVS